jgi:short-subunit dehydrogenase
VAPSRRSIPENLASGYFRGRTALVTGASSGIGRACAISLSRMGAKVALLARRQAALEELAAELVTDGNRSVVLPADVTERDAVHSAVANAINEFGHLDILINSAGILEPGPVDTMPLESLERMMRVNLYGTVNLTQAVLPSMRQAGSGHIVNVASLAGRRGIPSLGGYSATKFAVVGLTEALRVELHGSGVKVSLVLPGVVATPMTAEGAGFAALRGIPRALYAMPVQWVTWAIVTALAFGLAEVDVPPGAATLEKLGALMPGLTDAALALALRLQAKASG